MLDVAGQPPNENEDRGLNAPPDSSTTSTRVSMSMTDPGTLLKQLIDTHWTTAARHAWRQYEQRGRGAIVFTVRPSAPDNERTPLRYLTFNDPTAARKGTFAKLYELVHSYDPEEQVVAAAVLPDERTVFDVYDRTPTPPEAASS